MRAALYARVSTARQAGEDHFSLPAQKDMYLKRCAEKGYIPTGEYVDTESGRTTTRKGYQSLLIDARAGKFDVIVVRAIDRFGRDADEITVRTAELRQAGITIDPINTIAVDTLPSNTQFLMRAVEAYIAQNTSELIAANVTTGMRKSAASGRYQGRPPYGYHMEGGELTVNEQEAQVVRRIFSDYAEHNIGPRTIAKNLNRDGCNSRQGNGWVQQTINAILQRPAYKGLLVWDEVVVEGGVPEIVSPDLWERAQARRRARARVPGGQTHTSDYLLSGILWCECGARMTGRASHMKRGPKTYHSRFYVCTRWDGGADAEPNRHNARDLEERVIRDLVDATTSVTIRLEPPDSPLNELVEAKKELAAVASRRRALLDRLSREIITDADYLEAMGIVNADDASLTARVESLEQQVKDAEAARAEMASRPDAVKRLIEPDMSPQEQKAVIQAFVQKIIVKPGDPEPYIVA